jgi:hypothetical protein
MICETWRVLREDFVDSITQMENLPKHIVGASERHEQLERKSKAAEAALLEHETEHGCKPTRAAMEAEGIVARKNKLRMNETSAVGTGSKPSVRRRNEN